MRQTRASLPLSSDSLFSLMMMIRPWRTSSVLPADPPPSTQQSTYRWRQCSRHSPTDTAAVVLIITQKSVTLFNLAYSEFSTLFRCESSYWSTPADVWVKRNFPFFSLILENVCYLSSSITHHLILTGYLLVSKNVCCMLRLRLGLLYFLFYTLKKLQCQSAFILSSWQISQSWVDFFLWTQ